MQSVDYYQILEIGPDAKPDQIRSAYYKLAKRYHPDLIARSDGGAQGHERFLTIQKAYEVLGDAVARVAYDEQREKAQRSSGPSAVAAAGAKPEEHTNSKPAARTAPAKRNPSLEEIRQARQGFQRAEELLANGNHEKSLSVMQAVVRTVEDEPDYMSLFGYLLALNGQRLHVARDACRQAVEAQPYNIDFKARLAYVYQRAGLKNTANEFFSEVLRSDPKNAIARAHLSATPAAGLVASLKRMFRPN